LVRLMSADRLSAPTSFEELMTPRDSSDNSDVFLVVSVDTEEDNWTPTHKKITVENVREIPRLDRFFEHLGIRPTYFVAYQVLASPRASATLQDIASRSRTEYAAHLHPWNTPPVEELSSGNDTMLANLPKRVQLAKLAVVTEAYEDVFGASPTSFRAGRFGLGSETVSALLECGYRVDSSVTPFTSWKDFDDGPDFVGAPLAVYRIGKGIDVRVATPNGPVIEVPISRSGT